MTVISTIITRHCTAHASDSFVTVPRADGSLEVVEDQQSKLIRVEAWRGAMGYWGLARHSGWNTFDWLTTQANQSHKYPSPAAFAKSLAQQLTSAISKLPVAKPSDCGLGIHFTAYERVQDYWVPEFFCLSNWTDATYTVVSSMGFKVTRETYSALTKLQQADEHGEQACRLQVHAALQRGVMLLYNNGDPILFNPIANAIMESFKRLLERGQLKDPSLVSTHLSIVRRPVKVVSDVISDLAEPGRKGIGGRSHDLAISPGGVYESTTGD